MNANDEELQRKIEIDDDAQQGVDADAYRTVFAALKQQPDIHLKRTFADDLIQKLIAAREKRENRKDMFWFGFGMLVLVMGMVVSTGFILPYLKVENAATGLSGLLQYKGLILVAIVMFGIFGWLDDRLPKPHQSK